MSADDATRMRALVEREGASDSLAYFALRPDKSVIWSPTGKSAIAYRVVGGVMLASGDPLGDKEAWPGAINAFIERADGHGWIPAALGCGDVAAKAWARAGLAPFELGDEAIVDVESFHLEGRPMRNVRQTVTRVQRLGYTASVVRTGDLTQTRREDLGRQAAAWRGEVTERGFSMALGRIAGTSDPDAVLVVAHDAHGSIRGLLQFVPWGKTGWSLDVMRRDPAAANGVNELMITTALHHAAGLGVRNISLNFAVFRSTLERGERLGAGFFSVWLLRLLMAASRWWQIESLYRFNAKFQPSWNTRYLCYPTLADLPRVVAATLLAEAFVRPPRRLAGAMRQGSLTPTMH
jgi:lysyl-tRNA synthetase class 2